MNKEVEKKLEELLDLLNKKKENNFKESKEELKGDINKIIDESEKVIICITEKQIRGTGGLTDVLAAIFTGLDSMIENNGVPRELIIDMFDKIIRNEEHKDFFSELKKFVEESRI